MRTNLAVKRVYAPAVETDGFRVLVDRLWPRGLRKDTARIDLWAKDITPSDGLRRWFAHDPEKWREFQRRYLAELQAGAESFHAFASELSRHERVTLLVAARDEQHNHALVLLAALRDETSRTGTGCAPAAGAGHRISRDAEDPRK